MVRGSPPRATPIAAQKSEHLGHSVNLALGDDGGPRRCGLHHESKLLVELLCTVMVDCHVEGDPCPSVAAPSCLGVADQGRTDAIPATILVNGNGLEVGVAIGNPVKESEEPCRNRGDGPHPRRTPAGGTDERAVGGSPMLFRGVRGDHADDRGARLSERDVLIGEVVVRFQIGLSENPIGGLPEHEAKHAVCCRVDVSSKQEAFFELGLCRAESDVAVFHAGIVSGETHTNRGPSERATLRSARMGR